VAVFIAMFDFEFVFTNRPGNACQFRAAEIFISRRFISQSRRSRHGSFVVVNQKWKPIVPVTARGVT